MKTRTNLAAVVAALFIASCVGCATTEPNGSTQNTIALMDSIVPLSVAVEVSRDPSTIPYFRSAATLVGAAALDTNTTPAQVVLAVRDLKGKPEAELAVLGGVVLWQAWVAQQVGIVDGSQSQLILLALARDIKAGLPPATVKGIRAKQAKGRR